VATAKSKSMELRSSGMSAEEFSHFFNGWLDLIYSLSTSIRKEHHSNVLFTIIRDNILYFLENWDKFGTATSSDTVNLAQAIIKLLIFKRNDLAFSVEDTQVNVCALQVIMEVLEHFDEDFLASFDWGARHRSTDVEQE